MNRYTKIKDLLDFLYLDSSNPPYHIDLNSEFGFYASKSFALNMKKGNWYDPLLLQVIPRGEERKGSKDFVHDPCGDIKSSIMPGVVQKYAGRILLLTTPVCAIHCRFCFRRGLSYTIPSTIAQWDQIHNYLSEAKGIDEIILSGGDPLMLAFSQLQILLKTIAQFPHIATIRIHTRTPIAAPELLSQYHIDLFKDIATHTTLIIVVHSNHAQELNGMCIQSLALLRSAGAVLLNQSVLLKGINDSVETLERLSRELVRNSIVPYYLHQLDRVTGSHHFEVPEETGKALVRKLREILPGYAVPRYVREIPRKMSKTIIL